MAKLLKDSVLRVAMAPGIRPVWRRWLRGRSSILMFHRFASSSIGNRGFPLDDLRRQLALLRRERFTVLPLLELLQRIERGDAGVDRALAITVDDGYADFADAADVFDEFSCPATVFLTSGFLDRKIWMWWDRVERAFLETERQSCDFMLSGVRVTSSLRDIESRLSVSARCFELLKQPPTAQKLSDVAMIERMMEVELPALPTRQYEALTWQQVRALESRGHRFGPHTDTHPILSRCENTQAQQEITESWVRLTSEVSSPVPVFCYPNGDISSFSAREIAEIGRLGLRWAVTTERAYAETSVNEDTRMRIPRFSAPESVLDLEQLLTGFEAFKHHLRGR